MGYDVEIEGSNYIHEICVGSFTKKKAIEVVQVRGTDTIEIISLDVKRGIVNSIYKKKCFCVVRSISALNMYESEGERHYLCIGSDSGKISVLLFNRKRWDFEEMFSITYGKTGCRRIVP